jgi:hypothetical protein
MNGEPVVITEKAKPTRKRNTNKAQAGADSTAPLSGQSERVSDAARIVLECDCLFGGRDNRTDPVGCE